MLTARVPIVLSILAALPTLRAQEQEVAKKPTAAQEVASAVATANAKNKRALVAIVGEDDGFDDLVTSLKRDRTLSRQLLYEFVVVQVDAADGAAVAKERGADLAELGTPALLVLAGDGHLLAELNKYAFWSEEKGLEPATLSGVLEKLHAEPLDAKKLLADALATCEKTDKNLLLHFDAPW